MGAFYDHCLETLCEYQSPHSCAFALARYAYSCTPRRVAQIRRESVAPSATSTPSTVLWRKCTWLAAMRVVGIVMAASFRNHAQSAAQ